MERPIGSTRIADNEVVILMEACVSGEFDM